MYPGVCQPSSYATATAAGSFRRLPVSVLEYLVIVRISYVTIICNSLLGARGGLVVFLLFLFLFCVDFSSFSFASDDPD